MLLYRAGLRAVSRNALVSEINRWGCICKQLMHKQAKYSINNSIPSAYQAVDIRCSRPAPADIGGCRTPVTCDH
jgi:hypothetical protein